LLPRSILAAATLLVLAATTRAGDGPPVAPVKPVMDDYHGTKIVDPYRYMEDLKSPEVQAWIKGQSEFAEKALAAIPGRAALRTRIAELDAGAPFFLYGLVPFPNGDLFYFKMLVADNVPKLYRRDAASGAERLLIDPDKLPKKYSKEHVALGSCRVSQDGSKVLYCYGVSGSEQATLKVFDLASGRDLPEAIDRLETEDSSFAWMPDGNSFVYNRLRKLTPDAPPTEKYKFARVHRHVLGTDPEADPVVFADGAPGSPPMLATEFPAVDIPLESTWAIATLTNGVERDLRIYAAPRDQLGNPLMRWTKVCDKADQVIAYTVHGDDIYLITAKDAPRRRVVRTSLARPDLAQASVVVPTGPYVIETLGAAKDALYVGVLQGVPNKVLRVLYADGARATMLSATTEEPGHLLEGVRANVAGTFVRTFSWIRADRLERYDPTTNTLADTGLILLGKYDKPDNLIATEVLVPSHDGVEGPLSIVHRRDLRLDGSNPVLLTGYGAYGSTSGMYFDPMDLAWLERGGILATAYVRGGGAYGKE
jgi:prolyl oligopeptidase